MFKLQEPLAAFASGQVCLRNVKTGKDILDHLTVSPEKGS